jgi:hypothetical protein
VADISAVKITTSTATVAPALTRSVLVIADRNTWSESSISYTFELNAPLEPTTDTIALVLPLFTIGTAGGLSTSSGCGSTAFTAADTKSGTSTATLTLGAKTATLSAGSECTVTIGSGVTTSAKAQTANLNTRTVAVTLGRATNIAAVSGSISASTAVVAPTSGFQESKLVIANAVTEGPSSISYMFALNSPLETSTPDTIALLLPTFKFGGSLSAAASGCGTTTFTTSSTKTGTATATLTLSAQTATLNAYQEC